MKNYILKRTLILIPTFLGAMIILGMLFVSLPGNFVDGVDMQMTAAQDNKLIKMYHLDKPKVVQFLYWAKSASMGDFGGVYTANYNTDIDKLIPIAPMVKGATDSTLKLILLSIISAMLIAIPLGVASAARSGTSRGNVDKFISLLGISIPGFVFAAFLYNLLRFNNVVENYEAVHGIQSTTYFKYFIVCNLIPYIVLTIIFAAKLIRFIYISMLEVIHSEYITMARSYGFKEKKVLYKYALKNTLIPVVTIIGTSFPSLFSEVMVVQAAIGGGGLGSLFVGAIHSRQYNIAMAIALVLVVIVLVGNYLLDILYGYLDPRIKIKN